MDQRDGKSVYLVMVQLCLDGGTLLERLRESVPIFENTLRNVSNGDYRLAFRSAQGDTFGWLLATNLTARQILNNLDVPGGSSTPKDLRRPVQLAPSGSRWHDKFLVLEVGQDFDGAKLNTVTSWLGLHRGAAA